MIASRLMTVQQIVLNLRLQVWQGKREVFVVILLAAAILSPNISLIDSLPAVRIEQVLSPLLVAALAYHYWQTRRLPTFGILDLVFLGLGVSTIISIFIGPKIVDVPFSLRDLYEVVKIGLYYVMYRFARDVINPAPGGARLVLGGLLALGGVVATFSILQYFGPLGINDWLTPLYAPAHHLNAIKSAGRVVGTIANPNYYALFTAVITLAATAWLVFLRQEHRWTVFLIIAALGLAVQTLIMTMSRSALLALMTGLLWLFLIALLRRQPWKRLIAVYCLLAVMVLGSMAVQDAFAKSGATFLFRVRSAFAPEADNSFNLRLVRWKSLLAAPSAPAASAACLPATSAGTAAGGSQAGKITFSTSVAPSPMLRDAQRRDHLRALQEALAAYRCSKGRYPPPGEVYAALLPLMAGLPTDPATGEPYDIFVTDRSYSITARLEDPLDPNYPVYGVGNLTNFLKNSSLESVDNQHPHDWVTKGNVRVPPNNPALYGKSAAVIDGDGHTQTSYLLQQLYVNVPPGQTLTTSVWTNVPEYQRGGLSLYLVGIFDDGEWRDPLASVEIDTTQPGQWQRAFVSFSTGGKQLTYLTVMLVATDFVGRLQADGFQLVEGPQPVNYTVAPEGSISNASWYESLSISDSPIIGTGPAKSLGRSTVDNEYLLYLQRYGAIGLLFYLALYAVGFIIAWRAFRNDGDRSLMALAVAIQGVFLGLAFFNAFAGSFYQMQMMAIFWILVGYLAAHLHRRSREATL